MITLAADALRKYSGSKDCEERGGIEQTSGSSNVSSRLEALPASQ